MNTDNHAAETWIRATLLASAELVALVGDRIYRDAAPVDSTGLCIIYGSADGDDTVAVGGVRLLSELTYSVRAAEWLPAETDDAADQAAALIDSLLVGPGSPAGRIRGCVRRAPYTRRYEDQGREVAERGGFYAIFVGGT